MDAESTSACEHESRTPVISVGVQTMCKTLGIPDKVLREAASLVGQKHVDKESLIRYLLFIKHIDWNTAMRYRKVSKRPPTHYDSVRKRAAS